MSSISSTIPAKASLAQSTNEHPISQGPIPVSQPSHLTSNGSTKPSSLPSSTTITNKHSSSNNRSNTHPNTTNTTTNTNNNNNKVIVTIGGGFTAEAYELDRKTRLFQQLRLARNLRATMERALEEANTAATAVAVAAAVSSATTTHNAGNVIHGESKMTDGTGERIRRYGANGGILEGSPAAAVTTTTLPSAIHAVGWEQNATTVARRIFHRHIGDMKQLVSLTEAVMNRYTLDSYESPLMNMEGNTNKGNTANVSEEEKEPVVIPPHHRNTNDTNTHSTTKTTTVLDDLALDLAWESYPENLTLCAQRKWDQPKITDHATPTTTTTTKNNTKNNNNNTTVTSAATTIPPSTSRKKQQRPNKQPEQSKQPHPTTQQKRPRKKDGTFHKKTTTTATTSASSYNEHATKGYTPLPSHPTFSFMTNGPTTTTTTGTLTNKRSPNNHNNALTDRRSSTESAPPRTKRSYKRRKPLLPAPPSISMRGPILNVAVGTNTKNSSDDESDDEYGTTPTVVKRRRKRKKVVGGVTTTNGKQCDGNYGIRDAVNDRDAKPRSQSPRSQSPRNVFVDDDEDDAGTTATEDSNDVGSGGGKVGAGGGGGGGGRKQKRNKFGGGKQRRLPLSSTHILFEGGSVAAVGLKKKRRKSPGRDSKSIDGSIASASVSTTASPYSTSPLARPPVAIATAATVAPVKQMRKCHHCKKVSEEFRKCHFWLSSGIKCRKSYCRDCLVTRYGVDAATFNDGHNNNINIGGEMDDWHCPSCLGTCQCATCRKEQEKKAQWSRGSSSARRTASR